VKKQMKKNKKMIRMVDKKTLLKRRVFYKPN